MKNEEKFRGFLESLKTEETKTLIETVTEGFNSLFEEEIDVQSPSIEIFNKDELASMGANTLKRFIAKAKIGFGKTEEEASAALSAKYGVSPFGVMKTSNGFIAFYNGSEE